MAGLGSDSFWSSSCQLPAPQQGSSIHCSLSLSLCTPRNPLGCGVKEPLPERWKAKQFSTQPPKKGKTLDTYFEKTFTSIANDKYTDKWRYLDSGQEKQKGFGTSDFSKRDEFSNTTRTLQWREQLAVSVLVCLPACCLLA